MSTKQPLWTPQAERLAASNLTRYQQYLTTQHQRSFDDYFALHTWSVTERAQFWSSIWDFCKVKASVPATEVMVDGDQMMGTTWFQGARLNFAENLLRHRNDETALLFRNELKQERSISYNALYREVAKLTASMRAMGVEAGDRVAGYLPNIIETVIAMLATTSIGAIWSSTSPDFGHRGVLDRFGQIQPKLLFSADGYFYKAKRVDSLARLPKILEEIPSIEKVVVIPYTQAESEVDLSGLRDAVVWGQFQEHEATEVEFAQLPFDHPLYIMYSSGTTGVPKCIVHGAGGTLLQHLKEHVLHVDLKPNDAFFYFTTCGWMMWNWLVSGLASGAKVMLYDGSPFFPGPEVLFEYAQDHGMKVFGTSAKFLAALEKTGMVPRENFDLSSVEAVLSTGSPLSAASFEFVYRDIKADVHLASIAGGTDIISCFVLGVPHLPVYSEEIQAPGLGMKVDAWDGQGQSVRDDKGELVCTASFPSQPIYFWNDPDQAKYRSAYFDVYDNVWRHGDFIEITSRHGIIIYGRSDATLNPGGVRIGTAEIYRAVEPLEAVLDSLVVGHDIPGDVEVLLFVKLAQDATLDDELRKLLRQTIRKGTTPRHVPAKIFAVADIPYTISGKKVELAVRRVIHGQSVPNRDALANPEALDHFQQLHKTIEQG